MQRADMVMDVEDFHGAPQLAFCCDSQPLGETSLERVQVLVGLLQGVVGLFDGLHRGLRIGHQQMAAGHLELLDRLGELTSVARTSPSAAAVVLSMRPLRG